MAIFLECFRPSFRTRILDLGGYIYDWHNRVATDASITFLNLNKAETPGDSAWPERFQTLIGDGRQMPFQDGAFDIVYSNSVIEHVPTWDDQKRMAAEIRRVGRSYFVQTPNRWFPVEPHFITLFVHYLPLPLCRRIIPFLSLRGWVRSGDNADLSAMARELRLLTRHEMAQLFPEADIIAEKCFGLTKSWTAIYKSNQHVM